MFSFVKADTAASSLMFSFLDILENYICLEDID